MGQASFPNGQGLKSHQIWHQMSWSKVLITILFLRLSVSTLFTDKLPVVFGIGLYPSLVQAENLV